MLSAGDTTKMMAKMGWPGRWGCKVWGGSVAGRGVFW